MLWSPETIRPLITTLLPEVILIKAMTHLLSIGKIRDPQIYALNAVHHLGFSITVITAEVVVTFSAVHVAQEYLM